VTKNYLSKIANLVRALTHNAAVYRVGVILRWRWLERSLAPLLMRATQHGKPLVVLDAGSGNGLNAFPLARRYPASAWHGVELNPDLVRLCQARSAKEKLPNLTFTQGDLTESQGAERFDLAYSIDVIEHIEEDRLAIGNLARSLRPGGWLLIHTPLAPQRHWFHRFDLDQRAHPMHVREGYTVDDLQAKLREAGLEPLKLIYTHGRWGTLAWELWRLVEESQLLSLLLRLPVELLIAIELAFPPRWGNCVLIEAKKCDAPSAGS